MSINADVTLRLLFKQCVGSTNALPLTAVFKLFELVVVLKTVYFLD